MAVPKKRTPSSRRNRRRSHHGASPVALMACPKCKEQKMPHLTCENCGTYNGREVVDVMAKLEKKERKLKEQQLEEQGADK